MDQIKILLQSEFRKMEIFNLKTKSLILNISKYYTD
jgi:hypothetical protein